jgi:hypothetical protein
MGVPHSSTAGGTDESLPRSGDVAGEVAKLWAEVNQLKRNRAAKIATVLSVIATIVSVSGGALGLWQAFVKRSKTVVSTGPALKLTYDPGGHLLKITFDMMLRNLGNKDDAIRELSGKISDLQTSSFAPIGAEDFTCAITGSMGAQQAGTVFSVPKDGSTSAVCVGSIRLATLSRQVFQSPGTKQLHVLIYGDSAAPYLLTACFPLDEQAAAGMQSATGPVLLRTTYSVPCEPEEPK